MKTVNIPGLVVLLTPFLIYLAYWFISEMIFAYNDLSLCYCTRDGLNELPPSIWNRLFMVFLIFIGMIFTFSIIEWIINIWTNHLNSNEEIPYILLIVISIPVAIFSVISKGCEYINEKLTLKIKY